MTIGLIDSDKSFTCHNNSEVLEIRKICIEEFPFKKMMDQYKQALQATDNKKQTLDDEILEIRDLYKQQLKRHDNLLARQNDLSRINGGSNIQDSDIINLNVGGTKMRVLRETLTLVKGSRLEVLFSGRWESKLLRDEDGCVFFDMDPKFFKKIVEYLYSVKLFQEQKQDDDTGSLTLEADQPQLPTFEDPHDQAVLDLHVDFFRLRKNLDCTVDSEDINIHAAEDENSYDDLIVNEKEELAKVQKKLDEMERRLEEEESFVSFFTTPEQAHTDDNSTSDDGISFTSMTSDLDSNPSSDSVKEADIVTLSINDDIIPVKLSTLLLIKGSLLAEKFSSQEWIEKHTFASDNGRDVVLIEYPADAFKMIINQLRLLAVSESTSMESVPLLKKDEKMGKSLEHLVATLFKGNEDMFISKGSPFHESVILDSKDAWREQVVGWLDKADCDEFEPKLLYQASQDGWSTSKFHSKCDYQGPTLTVVRTGQGNVFGGYTDKSWNNSGGYVPSNEAFLFGLHCYGASNPTKMKIKNSYSSNAMYCYSTHGPTFGGGHDLRIGNDNDLTSCYSNLGNSYSRPSGASHYFFAANNFFTATEVEVFQV